MDGYVYVSGPIGHAEIPADALVEALAKHVNAQKTPPLKSRAAELSHVIWN